MNGVTVRLDGPPMAKGRPRHRKDGHTFTPERTLRYESRMAFEAQHVMAGRKLLTGPLTLQVIVRMPIPTSKPKKWQAEALAGTIRPTKKPDADNFAKIMDALNLIVWEDDSQVVDLHVSKMYSARPCMIMKVYTMTKQEVQDEGVFG